MAESRQQRRARERALAKHPDQVRVYETELRCYDRAETYGEPIEDDEDPEIWYAEGGWRDSSSGEDYGDAPLADLVQMVLETARRTRRPGRVRLEWILIDSAPEIGDARTVAAARGVDLPEWA
ncbi:MAG: hypothetical protein ACQEXM_27275 [Actinomycetota bacterium]|jgi:hypothetical protein